jgi:hypothetical protein
MALNTFNFYKCREDLIKELINIRRFIKIVPEQKWKPYTNQVILKPAPGNIILINSQTNWMISMRKLHEIYWDWINPRGIVFCRTKFVQLCNNLWQYTLGESLINYIKMYNKFKTLEKQIPCSYSLIQNPQQDKILLIKHSSNDSLFSILPPGNDHKLVV